MIRLVGVLVVVIILGSTSAPTEETLTPSVSSRIATHSGDLTYAVLAEQGNRSMDVNSDFQRLNDLHQYPKIIALARTRRDELNRVISKVHGMGLVAQERDRVLTPMRDEQNQMLRVIAAASEVQ
jgi:hypothetical protein